MCNQGCNCGCGFNTDLFKGTGIGNDPITLKIKAVAEKIVCSGCDTMAANDLIAGVVVQSNPGCKAKLANGEQTATWLTGAVNPLAACEAIDTVMVKVVDNSGNRAKSARAHEVVSQGICDLPAAQPIDRATGIVVYIENNCPGCPTGACRCTSKRMGLVELIAQLISSEAGNGLRVSAIDGKLKV